MSTDVSTISCSIFAVIVEERGWNRFEGRWVGGEDSYHTGKEYL